MLKIVKYNKKLQKILDINQSTYEENCLVIIDDEDDNIVKEYNKVGQLIYDGEYLNGKRNGKGKEYVHYIKV